MVDKYTEITLKQIGRLIRRRTNDTEEGRRDFNCAITGEPGDGKSVFTVQLGEATDQNYSLTKNVLYYPKPGDIIPRYDSLKSQQFLHIDETSRAIHKHKWWDPILQKLSEHYDTERWQRKATGFCIPRFWNLTENFRNDRIYMWIHIIERGVAVLNIKDVNKFQFDPWRLKENLRILNKQKNRRIRNENRKDKMDMELKNPNFYGFIYFDDLSPEKKEEYERLKIESRFLAKKEIDIEEETPATKRWKNTREQLKQVLNYTNKKCGIPQKELAKIVGLSTSAVCEMIRDSRSDSI